MARRILIVDDSDTARRQLTAEFEQAGYLVSQAREGQEALWRAREQRFDGVITDVHMSTMDGLTFVSELRQLDGYQNTPIFVLTSDSSRERVARGREVGATMWIIKPPDIPLLIDGMRQALEYGISKAPAGGGGQRGGGGS